MSPLVSVVNDLLSIGVVVAQVASIIVLAGLILKLVTKKSNTITEFTSNNAVLVSFAVALVATMGSLFYSEIAGFEPCVLCWYQRILMYPQVITLGLGLWDRNKGVVYSSIVFSIIGGSIAFYHYLGQIGATTLKCDIVGYSSACSTQFVLNFGYITIPLMAFAGFVLIFLSMITRWWEQGTQR